MNAVAVTSISQDVSLCDPSLPVLLVDDMCHSSSLHCTSSRTQFEVEVYYAATRIITLVPATDAGSPLIETFSFANLNIILPHAPRVPLLLQINCDGEQKHPRHRQFFEDETTIWISANLISSIQMLLMLQWVHVFWTRKSPGSREQPASS